MRSQNDSAAFRIRSEDDENLNEEEEEDENNAEDAVDANHEEKPKDENLEDQTTDTGGSFSTCEMILVGDEDEFSWPSDPHVVPKEQATNKGRTPLLMAVCCFAPCLTCKRTLSGDDAKLARAADQDHFSWPSDSHIVPKQQAMA